jgi:molybdopterin-guanine dinucleotide biosynthesis protein A
MTDVVEALGVREVAAPDPDSFLNVNRPEDLIQAAVCLSGRSVGER